MIPTIVIINDNNPLLNEYASLFSKLTRVVRRTSYQGEQLYSDANGPFFEGILFFDANGRKQLIRRDNYTTIIPEVIRALISTSNSEVTKNIKAYLDMQGISSSSTSYDLKYIDEEAKVVLNQYLLETYAKALTKSGTSGLGLYNNSGCTTSIATAVTGASGSNAITTTTLTSGSTTTIYAKATDVK